jgi:hypothetical protein
MSNGADDNPIEAIAVINNAISAHLTRSLLREDGIALNRVALILIRDVGVDWADDCAQVVRYSGEPRGGALAQRGFFGFFWRGAALLRKLRAQGGLREVYLVNCDNLLTSPLFIWAEQSDPRIPGITVVAEGIMNYQEITVRNRDAWRWRVKPLIARTLLRLPYRTPKGHLSGSSERSVKRIVSFTAHGLKAPQERIQILPFEMRQASRPTEKNSCLIVHTGLWQWMTEDAYLQLARAFVGWLSKQGFTRILTKAHPHVATGIIEELLPEHEEMTEQRSVEAMAGEISAGTVIGTCCTALATLKLMRPDLQCIDFGADFYCDHAYHGDHGVVDFLKGAGVEVLPSGLVPQAR